MTGRPDAFAFQIRPHAPGPYKLTADEATALMDKVRAIVPMDRLRKLTVLEVLDLYQGAKADYLIHAAEREPLRFEAKAVSE